VDTAILRNWRREHLLAAARGDGLIPLEFFGGFDHAGFDEAASPDLIGLLRKEQDPV
jgi:hypothetical protein